MIYLLGQGDQLLSTSQLFHFQWGQRKPTPRPAHPASAAMPDGEQAPSVLKTGPSALLLPCGCPRHPRGQLHPRAVFCLLLQPLHYLSLFITQMPEHNGLHIYSTEQKLIVLESGTCRAGISLQRCSHLSPLTPSQLFGPCIPFQPQPELQPSSSIPFQSQP